MGYSISWIAVRGKSADAVLAKLKLQRTGQFEEIPESPLAAVSLPGGWFLVFANDWAFADRAPLKKLSKSAELIACALDEHVMASGASGYHNGKEVWCMAHDSERGLSHLDVTGEPPREFAAISRRLTAKRSDAGGDESEVDYIFDVPVELAAKITGFRHDRAIGHATEFEVLK